MASAPLRAAGSGWIAFAVALLVITGKCVFMLWLGSRTRHIPEADER